MHVISSNAALANQADTTLTGLGHKRRGKVRTAKATPTAGALAAGQENDEDGSPALQGDLAAAATITVTVNENTEKGKVDLSPSNELTTSPNHHSLPLSPLIAVIAAAVGI